MKIGNKLEKYIIGLYAAYILVNAYFVFRYLQSDYFFDKLRYDPMFLLLESIPFFTVAIILFKRKYKTQISRTKNRVSQILKYIGLLLFAAFVLFIISLSAYLNSDLQIYFTSQNNPLLANAYLFIRDLIEVVWMAMILIFGVNFLENKGISQRYENLKDLIWTLLIIGILVPFSMSIGLLIYNLALKIRLFT